MNFQFSIFNFQFITWNVDPVAFQLGPFSLRWYSLLLALGFALAYITLTQIYKKEKVPSKYLDNFAFFTVLWTLIGLRLGHYLFYEPEAFIREPLQVFLPIDSKGHFIGFQGLASHGGVLGIIVYVSYYCWKKKVNFFWIVDRLAVSVLVAAAFVRIGNLMNHEIVGSITTMPWAFNFKHGGYGVANTFRHPAQLYESIIYLLIYGGMLLYYFKIAKGKIPAGRTTAWLFILVFSARFIIEFFKEVQVSKENLMALDIGQWLSLPFVLAGIGLLVYSYTNKRKIPQFEI